MKYKAGFLKVMCGWMVFLLQSSDAAHVSKRQASTGALCKLKPLTILTKAQVKECLAVFDEANGKDLPPWPPGFPELQIPQDSPLLGPTVQCSLLFMAQGLEKVLEDQKNDLNPNDVSLHQKFTDTISTVKTLIPCVRDVLGGECFLKPDPPKMPQLAFERKQWSHTLLEASWVYLAWLEHNTEANSITHFEGSGFQLVMQT